MDVEPLEHSSGTLTNLPNFADIIRTLGDPGQDPLAMRILSHHGAVPDLLGRAAACPQRQARPPARGGKGIVR